MLPYFFLAALNQIVWSITPCASNLVIRYWTVEQYAAARYFIGGALFLAFAVWRQRKLHVRWSDVPGLFFLGVVTYGLSSLGTLHGLRLGGVVNFAFASGMNATITAAVAILVLKEKVSPAFFWAVGLSIVGAFTLVWGKHSVSGLEIAGVSVLLVWGAYACEAVGFVYSKKRGSHLPLAEYVAYLQLAAAGFLFAVAPKPLVVPEMPALGWFSFGFVCLVACGVCVGVHYWLLKHLEGHRLAFFDGFHSISAAILGVILFKDPLNASMVIGGLLLFAAVFLISRVVNQPGDEEADKPSVMVESRDPLREAASG